ncbi:MAG TPA: ABC transporter substrate-binding protein [Myxococcaceae bacterium]|nr:ABC transporter substrate-binding protein [Myxococcaceae bacterium]
MRSPRFRRAAVSGALLAALTLSGPASAQQQQPMRVKIAVGGLSCLCYLPTVLAQQLGLYQKHGLDAELINFKGGSVALTAVLGGSADVVSGYYDHCVNLKAKNKNMKSIVVYDQVPGLVLVVSPKATEKVKSIQDLAGKKVGVSAPGSSTDFFLKYILRKNGIDPTRVPVIGVGLDDTAVAAQEQGQVDAAVMLDPAVTLLQGKYKDLRILADTRTEKDTLAVFGGKYPGGAIYATTEWVDKHPKESQAIAGAIVETLLWIHAHSAEEIMAKMPKDVVGANPDLYLAALKNALPMYSKDGRMDPKGAQAVLEVFSQSVPELAKAKVDLSTTYTNEFVDKAHQRRGG